MRTTNARTLAGAGVLFLGALAFSQCSAKPAAEPASPTAAQMGLTPVLTVQELMEHVVDPLSDTIFDAVGTDFTSAGLVETKPETDEDWLKIENGALQLAEASNLLKMPRRMAPDGHGVAVTLSDGTKPELEPAQIQAKVDADPARWASHADELRVAALDVLKVVRAKNVEGLFDAGTVIDRACENCHLEYWYPGDRKAVEADQKKRVTYDPPKAK
jgi:hypothetical protein